MEHVMNHGLDSPERSGQSDRRMRPQSAFVPRQSYFKHKGEGDDVGRPVLQHKPLAKGEFTQLSLAKVFEDDPGMRPKVFAPVSVNKISYALMNHDIAGAVPVPKSAPYKPRDTDPNAPRYILPGALPATVDAAATASATAAADSSCDVTNVAPRQPSEQNQMQQMQWNTRDTLKVSDINAVDSVTERPNKLEARHTQLNTRDVEGSWPGWEPCFRAHVGKNLRDPGLDVSDISGTCRRRRIFSARPTASSNRSNSSSVAMSPATSRDGPSIVGSSPHAAVATAATVNTRVQSSDQQQPVGASASASAERQQQQPQSYLPPPLSWQPVQYSTGGQPWSSEGSSSGSSSATRRYSHRTREDTQQQQQPEQQPQQQEEPIVHAAGAWPTTVTLPLRPAFSPPPFATHIPTGSVAAVLSATLEPAVASQTAAVADHPSATVGKATPGRKDARARHVAKLTLADIQRADAVEAQRVILSLRPSHEAVEEFFSSCRRLDRESCGKVVPTDFMHALERANLLSALEPGASGAAAEPATAAKALARGLQDGCGMVSYRHLARVLLGQALVQRSSPSKASAPAAPVSTAGAMPAVTGAAVPATTAAATTSQAGAAAAGEVREHQASVTPTSATGAALRPTLSRQTSDMQVDGSGKVTGPAVVDGANGPGNVVTAGGAIATCKETAVGDELSTAGAAQGPATSRRGVNWAPEPAILVDSAENSHADAPAMPATTPDLQDQRRLELQERQLRRESSARRRPYSAALGGPKGASAVAEVFKLLGASQPILYDTPPPPAVHVPVQSAGPATDVMQVSGSSYTAAKPAYNTSTLQATQQDPQKPSMPAPSTPSSVPYDGMGFGPHWPPEPRVSNLQKRPTSTIMEGSNLQLRDVCDVTYFPYKANALWFGGRVGPGGAEAPGGPAEAAREYQPSVDPLSFLVGKGHHRIYIAPTGHKLEPEVEAALVAKLRPKSALGNTPEADVRLKTSSSLVNQLNVDNPLLYPGRVDPNAPAGEALKQMLGSLYTTSGASSSIGATGGSRGSAASGAVRPATACTRRSTHSRSASVSKSMSMSLSSSGRGAAAGAATAVAASGRGGSTGARVGRVALERQIHKEELAAVRQLC